MNPPFYTPLNISKAAWEPTGNFGEDCDGHPSDARTRLSGIVSLNGLKMPIYAIEVRLHQQFKGVDDAPFDLTWLTVVNTELANFVCDLARIADWDTHHPELLEIAGRLYIVVMFPFPNQTESHDTPH